MGTGIIIRGDRLNTDVQIRKYHRGYAKGRALSMVKLVVALLAIGKSYVPK